MIDQHKGLTSPDGITYRLVPLEWIIPNPENYNQHPREQIDALKADFKRFGQVKPYVVKQQEETRFMLSAGEGCTIAAGELLEEDSKKYENLGWAKIVVVPDWWTDDDVIGFMAADNQTGRMSIPDEEKLLHILQRQKEAGYDLRSLGSDEEALRQMLANLEEENVTQELLGGDESVPLPEEEQTRVKPGDIWQLGRHRLLVADCTVVENMARLMDGRKAQIVIADPPYGITYEPNHDDRRVKHNYNGAGYHNVKHQGMITGDNVPFDPTAILSYFHNVREQFWWGADYYADLLPDRVKGSWLVWDKRADIEDMQFNTSHFELCWSRTKHLREIIRVKWFGIQGTEQQDIKRRLHPTQKPLQVISFLLEKYSEASGIVADPYLGSGTTLIACERTGHTCYGCEIEPDYSDVILRRYEAETGKSAQLLERLEVPL